MVHKQTFINMPLKGRWLVKWSVHSSVMKVSSLNPARSSPVSHSYKWVPGLLLEMWKGRQPGLMLTTFSNVSAGQVKYRNKSSCMAQRHDTCFNFYLSS